MVLNTIEFEIWGHRTTNRFHIKDYWSLLRDRCKSEHGGPLQPRRCNPPTQIPACSLVASGGLMVKGRQRARGEKRGESCRAIKFVWPSSPKQTARSDLVQHSLTKKGGAPNMNGKLLEKGERGTICMSRAKKDEVIETVREHRVKGLQGAMRGGSPTKQANIFDSRTHQWVREQ